MVHPALRSSHIMWFETANEMTSNVFVVTPATSHGTNFGCRHGGDLMLRHIFLVTHQISS